MAENLFDVVIGSTPDAGSKRLPPEGPYLARVRGIKIVDGSKGQGIRMEFTLLESLHNEDMTGVELSRVRGVSGTVWVTTAALNNTLRILTRINKEVSGKSVREALEYLPSSEVVLDLVHNTRIAKDGVTVEGPFIEVKGYNSVEWYMANRAA